MNNMLPLKKDYDYAFVGLLMRESGRSHSIDELYSVAKEIFREAVGKYGFKAEEIFFDPTIFPLAIDMPMEPGQPSYTYKALETIKKIKNDPQTSDIPVIMVTALNEFGDIERGIDSGTDDFISKPVNKLELLTRVKTMLKLKHLTDELERTLAYLSEIERQGQITKSDSK